MASPYGGNDPRELAAYSVKNAAEYLGIPARTLRSWSYGQPYSTKGGERWFSALITTPPDGGLSFMNLLEAYVLTALRRQHFVPMREIRSVLDRILKKQPKIKYPLATEHFATIGRQLFVKEAGVHTTPDGQTSLGDLLDIYFKRIEHAPDGWGMKLYPFPRLFMGKPDASRAVSLTPVLAYGKPVLDGTRIPTAIIRDRILTGETPREIAEDYDRSEGEILDAIRWELAAAA